MANVKFVKGSDVSLTLDIQNKTTGEPLSLQGFTGCTGYFAKDDGTSLAVTGTLMSADLGRINISLTDADTDLLSSGNAQSFEVHIDQGATKTKVQFTEALEILDTLVV